MRSGDIIRIFWLGHACHGEEATVDRTLGWDGKILGGFVVLNDDAPPPFGIPEQIYLTRAQAPLVSPLLLLAREAPE